MKIEPPNGYKPTKGGATKGRWCPVHYLTGHDEDESQEWREFSMKTGLLDHCETFLDRTTRERIFVSHPCSIDIEQLENMRRILSGCGVEMAWFKDSWYSELTWRIELRNAKLRDLIARGDCSFVLKHRKRPVLIG